MRIYDLIAKKRDGGTHTREELEAIVNGFVSGEVADYQMAAWMMAVYLRGMTNDVYFQIGLVTLLGLAAKNAILIVEFAIYKMDEGMKPMAAAVEAARLRFRPILMTSLAFILGVLPLALSSGAGAAARQSVGTGVMGGMLAATFLAIFFVPLFFVLIVAGVRGLRHHPETAG